MLATKACGSSFENSNVKIVGGEVAAAGSWPSMAYITWKYSSTVLLYNGNSKNLSVEFACDGTLISPLVILTG